MAGISISTAWEETTAFVAREFRLLVPLVAALLFLPSVVADLAAPPSGTSTANAPPLYLFLFVLSALVGVVGQLAIVRLALGHRERLGDSIGHAARRTPAYVGAVMLFAFPFTLLFGLLAGPMQAAAKAGNQGLALVFALAITILFVAFVILFVRFLLNGSIAAVEAGGPVAILKRGLALTRGNALRLFGAVLLFLIGGAIATYAVTVAVGSLATLLLGPPEPLSVPALLEAIAGGELPGEVRVSVDADGELTYAVTPAVRDSGYSFGDGIAAAEERAELAAGG